MFSAQSLAVPFFAAGAVLAASGWAKLWHPGSLVRMLTSTGLRVGPTHVRALAVVELGIGMLCLAAPGRAAAIGMGSLYGLFAVFIGWLLVRGAEVSSCGCAGDRDVPPSWIHVGLNLAAAAAGLGSGAIGPPFHGVVGTAAGLPLAGIGFVVGIAVIATLAALSVAYLPTVLWAYRGGR